LHRPKDDEELQTEHVRTIAARFEYARNLVKEHLKEYQVVYARKFNKKAKPYEFHENQRVMKKIHFFDTEVTTKKVSARFQGPYFIHKILNASTVVLRTEKGEILPTNVPIRDLKAYPERPEHLTGYEITNPLQRGNMIKPLLRQTSMNTRSKSEEDVGDDTNVDMEDESLSELVSNVRREVVDVETKSRASLTDALNVDKTGDNVHLAEPEIQIEDPIENEDQNILQDSDLPDPPQGLYVTRAGRVSRPPKRYGYDKE